ncbi:hypothetical protein [Pinibacter soli]|uniref:Carboxypeptidase regulatory-like domain-containing protein n=1 Tax=Pinibacter soli TaxID=3044211 RepID=A0ABT6RGB1_9BACT|nr:hypothetical protein [Pinibacter soli]MDI3321611.1 hypothetical protein [Pinibacter soli]
MKTLLVTLLAIAFQFAFAQQPNKSTPFPGRDSVYISGKVVDESGKPMENVMVLVYPFYTEKFDVTWYEQDTFYTNTEGKYVAALNSGQFSNHLYFKAKDCLPSSIYLPNKSYWQIADEPVKLLSRKQHYFDTRKIDKKDLSLTVEKALQKYKVSISQTKLFSYPTDIGNMRGLRFETADSSMIVLATENFYNNPATNKSDLLDRKITGIGIAFVNGDKVILGNGLEIAERKIYNEYFQEKKDLEAKQQPQKKQ